MSHLRQIKRTTRGLLAELGDTPDEVASTLRSTGVQGIPRDNRSCAVALYLSALVGTHPCIRSVTVGHCSLMLTLVAPADARPAGRLWVQLPKPVRGFVAAFDTRQYPEVTRNTTAPSPRGAGRPSAEPTPDPSRPASDPVSVRPGGATPDTWP
jgi:hypothetical protein